MRDFIRAEQLGDVSSPELLSENLELSEAASELFEAELQVPMIVNTDASLRLKVIDRCGLTCTFCHNEGTPVAVDNQGRTEQFVTIGEKTQRASIYVADNGVDFLPGVVSTEHSDKQLEAALSQLESAIDVDEVHLTGGEPTLHPDLPGVVRQLKERGLGVKITSNGERFAPQAAALADAGLDKVVFSIFGTTAEELAAVQAERYANTSFAQRKLTALEESFEAAAQHGIAINANIVMPDATHAARVARVIEQFGDVAQIRILNSLDEGAESYAAIYEFLAEHGAAPVVTKMTAGASGMSTDYLLPDGKMVGFKKIRKSHLEACDDCHFKESNCQEGYYGVRMYIDQEGDYRAGVCIQRMDLTTPIDTFVAGPLPGQIMRHRQEEADMLQAEAGGIQE